MTEEKLQKVLARAGLASRRAAEELIAAGRVKVNGERAHVGQRVDAMKDKVEVDGSPLPVNPDLVYYLLNKPSGVVSTAHDPEGRETVIDLVPSHPRVVPVGRLDYDTEGLLILTNDGDLVQGLTHPRHGVPKKYLALVKGVPTAKALRVLQTGVELEDGKTAPARVRVIQSAQGQSQLEIEIHEGRNRQVRRMCEAVGLPVERLVRKSVGPLYLGRLRLGSYRELTVKEVQALFDSLT